MLGPCGRRNVIIEHCGALTVTNDGATLLSHLRYIVSIYQDLAYLDCSVDHPVASNLVSLSRSMDRFKDVQLPYMYESSPAALLVMGQPL